jgi:GT2 family glycosyltransferase
LEALQLTAIVPATDRPDTLAACREAIESAHDGPEEVIVVDVPEHSGPAAARNAGAMPASGDILVFVDADVAVHPDAFRRIRAAFAADSELTAVFGSYCDAPAVDGVVANFRNLLHHYVHQGAAGPAYSFWSGLGAIRRDAFHESGGFDATEYRTPMMEDIELGMRLVDGGARIVLDPELLGTHMKAWSLRGMVRTDLKGRGIPWVTLLARRGELPSSLNLAWRHRLSALATVCAAASAVGRRPRTAAAFAAGQIALDLPLYALLLRRRGPAEAIAGVGLHAVHNLTAVAAVPVGLAIYARDRGRPNLPGVGARVAAERQAAADRTIRTA